MKIDHDVHVHTTLSSCHHDDRHTPANILPRAAELGLRTVGFANHMWDRAVPGASDWYARQDLDHVLSIREQIPADTGGVRVLIGCETEYCGGGKFGISPAAAERLDYVLIPHSHLHMIGFTTPPGGFAGPGEVADVLCRRFDEVVASGLATGVAHPFLALGWEEHADAIVAAIPDRRLLDCFGRAAEANVSIEIHTGMFPALGRDKERLHSEETFLRVLSLARQAGCRFHFTSDAHALADLALTPRLAPYADKLGLTEADIHPAFAGTDSEPGI